MEKILNYINGELIEPLNGGYFDNYNPSNGKVYSLVADGEKADIDHAVEAAKEAFKTWSKTSKQERSNVLMKLADTIEIDAIRRDLTFNSIYINLLGEISDFYLGELIYEFWDIVLNYTFYQTQLKVSILL